MNVAFACPKCDNTTQVDFDETTAHLQCCHCHHEFAVPKDAVTGEQIGRCLACPSRELYVRKDFPQRLGVTIVCIGVVLSSITWYYHSWMGTFAVLFATAAIDLVLYWLTGNLLQCYRCHAQYRDVPGIEAYRPFDLEVHERFRQEQIRLEESQRAKSAAASSSSDTPYSSPTQAVGGE